MSELHDSSMAAQESLLSGAVDKAPERQEPVFDLSSATAFTPMLPRQSCAGKKLCFSSKHVYALKSTMAPLAKAEDEGEGEEQGLTSLYPCYIACGCLAAVQVRAIHTGAAQSEEAVRLMLHTSQGADDVTSQRCAFFHPLPDMTFDRWRRHWTVFANAMRQYERRSSIVRADHYVGVSQVDKEVLEMIGLPLSRLMADDVCRRSRTAGGDGSVAAALETLSCNLEDVDAIPM
ncbi:hypothetical protein ABL78_1776 [Leptomonas seymouri]|uniref:Uncharacterized protein n=1 Tax=Leptomonas seymouri TaxID=5684 RepID=A0A0N1I1R6_LEPSE|nr:hypothetical protein ABL78_1776 [Leptomonas seymouri]|eukprot:KPI89132.1 hypothetical protein ABL78_1776 [Leptomonas seymouri]